MILFARKTQRLVIVVPRAFCCSVVTVQQCQQKITNVECSGRLIDFDSMVLKNTNCAYKSSHHDHAYDIRRSHQGAIIELFSHTQTKKEPAHENGRKTVMAHALHRVAVRCSRSLSSTKTMP